MPASPRPSAPSLTRRTFLLGAAGAAGTAMLAACGDDGAAPVTTSSPAAPTTQPGFVLGIGFPQSGHVATGTPQRLPFLIRQPTGGNIASADAPPELTFTATSDAGDTIPATTVAVHGTHPDFDIPYWPLVVTFPSPGVWSLATEVAGAPVTRELEALPPEQVGVPQLGEPLPPVVTPTVAAPGDVVTICTNDPVCPFHELAVTEALAAGRPFALLVSTPAFCQLGTCGPVLDLLTAAPRTVDTVHLEVYPFGSPPEHPASPALNDPTGPNLGLQLEPVLFVVGADGRVTARLDTIYDVAELTAALASASA